jgi:hypothetical protein
MASTDVGLNRRPVRPLPAPARLPPRGRWKDSCHVETLCALGVWRDWIDVADEDPRHELTFQAQLVDFSQQLRQEGGSVTRRGSRGQLRPVAGVTNADRACWVGRPTRPVGDASILTGMPASPATNPAGVAAHNLPNKLILLDEVATHSYDISKLLSQLGGAMPVSIPMTITVSDEGITAIIEALGLDAFIPPQAGGDDPDGERVLDIEFPDGWTPIESRDDESYRWPNAPEPEAYKQFDVYEGTTTQGTIRIGIGRCRRAHVWGKGRSYLITFHVTPGGGKYPLCEFLETDDYSDTQELTAIIRGNGPTRRAMYDAGVRPPGVYARFNVGIYSKYVRAPKAWNKWAVIAGEDDIDTILGHSLIQANLRFEIKPK